MCGPGGTPQAACRAARAALLGIFLVASSMVLLASPASAQATTIDACGRYTTTFNYTAAGVPVGQGIAVARNGGPSRTPVCVAVNGGPTFWAYCLNDQLNPCAPFDGAQPNASLRFTRNRAASAVANDPRFNYPWQNDQLTLARMRWAIDHGDESTATGRFAIAQAIWFLTGQRSTDPGGLGIQARQAVTAVAASPSLSITRLTPERLPVGRVHVFQVTSTERSIQFLQRPGITPFLCDATGRTVEVPGISVTAAGLTDSEASVATKTYSVCFLGTNAGTVRLAAEAPNPLLELQIWYPTNRVCQGFFDALRSVPRPLAADTSADFGQSGGGGGGGGGGSPPVTLPPTGSSTPAPLGLAAVLIALGAGVTLASRLRRRSAVTEPS